MRLKVDLFSNWTRVNDENGPARFCRRGSTNAFQVSWAEYRGKQPLANVSLDKLKDFAVDFGRKNSSGELVESSSGTCGFGSFGTAVFRSEQHSRIQVWILTDGSDHILATHICDQPPEQNEIDEARRIATSLALGPEEPIKPKWKFW